MEFGGVLDPYARRARLAPICIVLLPLGILVGASAPEIGWVSRLGALVGTPAILAPLLIEFSRRAGKTAEPGLWRAWGGPPTTRLLRHAGNANAALRREYHASLRRLGLDVPTSEEEVADHSDAEERYEACVRFLRAKTYDAEKFPMVFKENVSYGFARNLWALRSWAIGIAAFALLVVLGSAAVALVHGARPGLEVAIAVPILVGLLSFHIWSLTPDFVEASAESYAEQLLAASFQLHAEGVRQTA